MIDMNTFTVAGKVASVDLNDNGNVAKATVYVAVNDTPNSFDGNEPKEKWTKVRVIFFGDEAFAVNELKRGTSIVIQGAFNYYKGTTNNGKEFESYQSIGKRYWTPSALPAKAKAKAKPKPDPEPTDDGGEEIPW